MVLALSRSIIRYIVVKNCSHCEFVYEFEKLYIQKLVNNLATKIIRVALYYNIIIIQAMTRKIIKIGDSTGITIPQDILKKQGLKLGQTVEVEGGGKPGEIRITVPAENDQRTQRIAKRTADFIDRYRDDLKSLADR